MSATTRSWRQRCIDADPGFLGIDAVRPVVYEFSNGRKFRQPIDPYGGGAPPEDFVLDDSLLDGPDVLV